jgi:hypothetical protein
MAAKSSGEAWEANFSLGDLDFMKEFYHEIS